MIPQNAAPTRKCGRRVRPAGLKQMHDQRRKKTNAAKHYPDHAQPNSRPDQHRHAGNNRRRRQHNSALHRARREFVVMISSERAITTHRGLLGARGKLLAPLASIGLRIITIGRFASGCDTLLKRAACLGRCDMRHHQFALLGRRAGDRHAYRLGLKKRPQVGCFNILVQRQRLRAVAQRFRKRQHQRQYRDHQSDTFLLAPPYPSPAPDISAPFDD